MSEGYRNGIQLVTFFRFILSVQLGVLLPMHYGHEYPCPSATYCSCISFFKVFSFLIGCRGQAEWRNGFLFLTINTINRFVYQNHVVWCLLVLHSGGDIDRQSHCSHYSLLWQHISKIRFPGEEYMGTLLMIRLFLSSLLYAGIIIQFNIYSNHRRKYTYLHNMISQKYSLPRTPQAQRTTRLHHLCPSMRTKSWRR